MLSCSASSFKTWIDEEYFKSDYKILNKYTHKKMKIMQKSHNCNSYDAVYLYLKVNIMKFISFHTIVYNE